MSKILLNPYRNNLSIAGLTLKHDDWLDQAVLTDSDVYHKTLHVENLYATNEIIFTGNITEIETQHLLIQDNIIDINADNQNPLLNAGIAIRRSGILDPYQILYTETDQMLRIGFPGSMQAVATREDNPTNNFLSVWSATQGKFVTTDTLTVPIKFGSGYFTDSVTLGTFTNAPKLYGNPSNGNLYIETIGDIIYNTGNNFIFPVGRTLKFSTDTDIYADALNGVHIDSPRVIFSNATKLLWGTSGMIYSSNSGNNLNIDGTQLLIGSGTLSLSAGTIFQHEVISCQPTVNNSYTIQSQGDLFLTANSPNAIVVSKLSINKKGTFSTDPFGNLSIDWNGDIFFTPANKILINQGKSICFINENLGITADTNTGNVLLFSNRGITLNATNGVFLPINVPLNIATNTSISELPNGETRIASSSNHIQLVPGPMKNVKIPMSTALQFANDEVIVSDGINLSIVATNQIQFSSPLGLNIPKGTPMNFGDLYHRIYQDVSLNMIVESTQNIVLNATDTVEILGNNLNLAGALIYRDTDSALTLKSPIGISFLKTENSIRVTNETIATTFYNAAISTLGGMYVTKNLIVAGPSQFSGSLNLANVFAVNDLGVPLTLQNSSVVDGTAISVISTWDPSTNYTIGRGSTGLNGGRSLVFTIPTYTSYSSTGVTPGFFFGSNVGNEYVFISDTETRITQGKLTVNDASNNALNVQGRINVGSIFTNNSSFTLTNSGINTTLSTTVNNSFTVKNTAGTTILFSVNPGSVVSNTNYTITGNATIGGVVNISGIVTAGNGINVSGGPVDMNNQMIKNLQLPQIDTDAANKFYVDAVARGMSQKMAVTAASTGDIDLNQVLSTLDGVILSQHSRILIKNQVDLRENGIYTIDSSFLPQRSLDMPSGTSASGVSVFVTSGTLNGGNGFVVVGTNVTVDVDQIEFTIFSAAAQINPGPGLSRIGTQILINVDAISIGISSSNKLEIPTTFFGTGITGGGSSSIETDTNQSHVTEIGILTTGTWNADNISVAYGGTGKATFEPGKLIYGDTDNPMGSAEIYYSSTTKYVGINNTSPSKTLDIHSPSGSVSGTWIQLLDPNPLLTQSSGILIASLLHNSSLYLANDGTLNISQDTGSSSSRIRFSTQGTSRLFIDSVGNIGIGTESLIPGNILTVIGKSTFTDEMTVLSTLTLPSLTILDLGNGVSKFQSASIEFSNGIKVATDATIGNLKFVSTIPGESLIESVDKITGISIPLKLRASPTVLSAICTSDGLLVPEILQIGGFPNDPGSGFSITTEADILTVTPGIPGNEATFKCPISTNDSIQIFDSASSTDRMKMTMQGTSCYIKSFATGGTVTPFYFNIGGGTNDVVVSMTNTYGDAYVKYDPTDTSTIYPGGTFSVSDNVMASFGNIVKIAHSIAFVAGNSLEAIVVNSGWYYLGQLQIGRVCITASLSWKIRIDYDGVSNYVVVSEIHDRNVISLVIYRNTNDGNYHMYLQVISGPCKVSILESPNELSLNSYEGIGIEPDGTYSNYDSNTYTIDLDLFTAQSNANVDFGRITVSDSADFNNTTLTGVTNIYGELNTRSLSLTGSNFTIYEPHDNVPSFMMDTNFINATNILQVSGILNDGNSVPKIKLLRGNEETSLSISPDNSLYPGAFMITHESLDATSAIIFATKNAPQMIISSVGNVSVLSTSDTFATEEVALVVSGGSIFKKDAYFTNEVSMESLTVRNSNGQEFTINSTATGNIDINAKKIVNVGNPTSDFDAVNKKYVEDRIQGLSLKQSVLAASTGNVDISQPITILDSIIVLEGSRILLKDQTDASQNGIYIVQYQASPIRSSDLFTGSHAAAVYVFVNKGVVNESSGWACSTPSGSDVVGVNNISFVQFSGAGQISAGPGMIKNGNILSVNVDNTSLEINNGIIRVADDIAGTGLTGGSGSPLSITSITHLNSVGMITTGTWRASTIAMGYGGTGNTNFSVGRIPFSNGISLIQGNLYFDELNVRLGINTVTPTAGLSLLDRDISIDSGSNVQTYALLTSTYANYTYAIRNDINTNNFVISGGQGTNKLTLTDLLTIDSTTGNMTVGSGISSQYLQLSSAYKYTGGTIEKNTAGPNGISVYSSDNTGSYIQFYGAVGTVSSTASSEYIRMGFYTGNYSIATNATGSGVVRNINLQTGNNVGQFVLTNDGNITSNGIMSVTSTEDANDFTTGACRISGGLTVMKNIYMNNATVVSSDDDAVNIASGGITSLKQIMKDTANGLDYMKYLNGADGSLGIVSRTGASDTMVNIHSSSALNTNAVMMRLFGYGTSATNVSSEYLEIGINPTIDLHYRIRTMNGGIGNQRNLILSAVTGIDQMILNSDSTVTINSELTTNSINILGTTDATSSSNGGTMTIRGGTSIQKTLIVGGQIVTPVSRITNYTEYTNAGSIDKVSMKYISNGQLNFYNNSAMTLCIHTGNSTPGTATEEKLVIGADGNNAYTISAINTGNGTVSRDITMRTNGQDYIRLNSLAQETQFSTKVTNISSEDCSGIGTGSIQTSGGIYAAKNIYSDGIVTGDTFIISTLTPWKYEAISSTELTLYPINVDSIFSIKDLSRNKALLSIDTVASTVTMGGNTVVKNTNIKGFVVQNGNGNDHFIIDTVTGVIDACGNTISNVKYPSLSNDAANKAYVDNLVKGLKVKQSVDAGSYTNVNILQPVTTLDSVTLSEGYRILLMAQDNPVENGIYVITTGNYIIRADDLLTNSNSSGVFTFVTGGAIKGEKGYVCFSSAPNDIVGQHDINFTQFNGNVITAGSGLIKDGNNVVNIALDSYSGLSFNADKLRIDPSSIGPGLSFVNGVLSTTSGGSVGTVTGGIWQASTIQVLYGGTGNTTFSDTGIVYSDGSKLVSNVTDFSWDYTKKALGINGTPDPNATGDGITVTSRDVTLESGGIYLGKSSNHHYMWSMRNTAGNNFVIAAGDTLTKGSLTDLFVYTNQGNLGINYTDANSASITDTLSVNGTMNVTGSVTLSTVLTVSSGGTGVSTFTKGVLYSTGGTGNIVSTGGLTSGQMIIGKSDNSGDLVLESGGTLRSHIGVAIGSDVQAWSTRLDNLSSLTPTASYIIMGNGSSFASSSPSAVSTALGLGTLAYINTINDSNWSGTVLSITNGGTGTGTFTASAIPYYDSGTSKLNSGSIYYDATNVGVAIGGTGVISGSGLSVHGKDLSISASSNTTTNSVIFYQADKTSAAWRLSRVDEDSTNSTFTIAGGVPNSTASALTDRLTISSSGVVAVTGTTTGTTIGSGTLVVSGATSIDGSINTSGIMRIYNTTDYTSSTVASLIVSGGIYVGKNTNMAGNLTITGTLTTSNTTDATNSTTGSVHLSGGLAVEKTIYTGGQMIIDRTGTLSIADTASGITTSSNIASWTANTVISNTNRSSLLLNNSSTGAVILSMKNLTSTNGWDMILEGTGNNRLIWQSQDIANTTAKTWMTLNPTNGTLTINATGDGTSGSTAALSIAGGISSNGTIVSIGGLIDKSTNGAVTSVISNTNTGNAATTKVQFTNDTGNASVTLNGSNVTTNGNSLVVKNDVGKVIIQGANNKGLIISETNGSVTFDSSVIVTSTTDASSTSSGGSATISGGLAVAKDTYIGGNLFVTGTFSTPGAVTNPTITTAAGDLINVSLLTVVSATAITINTQIMLMLAFEVTPSSGSLNTQFTFNLPGKSSNLASRLDITTGQMSGYTDDTNLIVLENLLCTGVTAEKKAIVKFQSNSTGIHYLQVMVSYSTV